ncbi:hypothetical protein LCGC14_1879670 [marine sediment metagenome]|uniref:Uncharacterized protein n=1 Tax=marine sediment metagenome TaxID=412755 RepID=A0A0F9J153_9ZZZZ
MAQNLHWRWKSNVRITVRESGLIVGEFVTHNVITRSSLTLAREALRGSGDLTIQQVGVGAGATAPSDEDTDMDDERLRVDIILRQAIGIDALLTTAYVAPEEANTFTINELGWWGEDATGALGSGTLMSRVLYNRTKVSSESLQIDRLDTFSEGP